MVQWGKLMSIKVFQAVMCGANLKKFWQLMQLNVYADQVTFISSAESFLKFASSGLMVTFSHLTKIDMSPLDMDLKCVNFGGACVNFGEAV